MPQNDDDSVSQEVLPLTMEKLADQVEDVIQHYALPQCMGAYALGLPRRLVDGVLKEWASVQVDT